jgi:S-adenosylmethionine synthetase
VPNNTFVGFRLIAEEIEVEVVSSIGPYKPQFIRIDAENYSVQNDELNTILSKKFTYLNKSKYLFIDLDLTSTSSLM